MSDDQITQIENVEQLHEYGLSLRQLNQVRGTLVWEEPASVQVAITGLVTVGAYSYTGGGGKVRNLSIGRFCSIGKGLNTHFYHHPTDFVTQHPFVYDGTRHFDFWPGYEGYKKAEKYRSPRYADERTIIGSDVWIGDRVSIPTPVTIGTGAVLAAEATVTKNINAYEIVGGNPAKVISHRFRQLEDRDRHETTGFLLTDRWWELDLSALPGGTLTDPIAYRAWREANPEPDKFKPRTWMMQWDRKEGYRLRAYTGDPIDI